MTTLRCRAALLLALIVASHGAFGSPEQIASSQAIACSDTPFGQRLTLGLEQEYVVVHPDATHGTQSEVRDNGAALPLAGSAVLAGTFNLATVVTTHIDLDGDGQDEWAVAGVKASDAHRLIVITFRRDPNQGSLVGQSAPYEWDAGANIVDLQIAAADLTGRDTNSRQELVVAYRISSGAKVIVLNGTAASPTIQQASGLALGQWTMPADADGFSNLRLATGDVLLEGRDQIALMGVSTFNTKRVYYLLRYDDTPGLHLNHTRYTENRVNSDPIAGFYLHIADFGGTAASEMLVHDQEQITEGGGPGNVHQEVKYFETVRDVVNKQLITNIIFHSAPGTNLINITTRPFVVAVGELDRRPGAEIVVARQNNGDIDNHLIIQLYKVDFDIHGDPVSIGPYLSPISPFNPIMIDQEMFVPDMTNHFDITVGQPRADSIGEVAVAVQDQVSLGDTTKRLKVRTYAMARPSPNPNTNPIPTSFGLTGSFDYPASVSNNVSVHIDHLDFDGDSVLADIDASNCMQVREPMLRSVVHLPPYWTLLQGSSGNFLATIGKTKTGGTTQDSTYGTFTSHDISGYVGVKVGGEVMGIGAEVSAKVTAGYNYQASRGKSYGTSNTLTVSESQQQSQGEGLVVEEDNTFNCYTYNVHTLGLDAPASSVRSCEVIRYDPLNPQNELRAFSASDLVTWDTQSAYNLGVGVPAQWIPLAPDWASVALFHVPKSNTGLAANVLAAATDGQFATAVASAAIVHPYLEIDLGNNKPLTNVRVFPQSGHAADLAGFYLYVSATPFTSGNPPSGPGVTVFAPDPDSGNGIDHWNVWLRNPATQAPLLGRFLRLQAPGASAKKLAISEIQAFADTHIEPPGYPVSVCDTVASDGVFTALMYDALSAAYRKVDVRGELLWKGTTETDPACGTDIAAVRLVQIWNTTIINASGTNSWDLSSVTGQTVGTTTSIEHSTRVGAELDASAGAVVQAEVGGAYEFSTGVTEENSSSMFWESGLEYAGQVGGMSPARLECGYRAQPFAYIAVETSNIGYEHRFTEVDYFVPDFNFNRSTPNSPPVTCYSVPPDRFFSSGFE